MQQIITTEDIVNLINTVDSSATLIQDYVYIIQVNKANICQILKILKDDPTMRFTILTDLFAADFPSKAQRFEVVYNLLSLKLNRRIMIKISVDDKKQVPSITSVFAVSNWYEREIFDMFGIEFTNHPNLVRILTDYGFIGHPLRKDFPLTGYTQVRYDTKLEQVIYEPVNLEQEYREFDFSSNWQGPNYINQQILPGDEKANIKNNK